MEFQNVTVPSDAGGRTGPWKTGVTMVDINGDNKLDIYVCYSGWSRTKTALTSSLSTKAMTKKEFHISVKKRKSMVWQAPPIVTRHISSTMITMEISDAILLNHNPKSLPILNEVSTAECLKKMIL